MTESAAFCAKQVAKDLNAGKGDSAEHKLLECSSKLAAADPVEHKAWTDRQKATNPEDWLNATERVAAEMSKINPKLWNEVINAQGPDTSKQLCKLELTKDGETVTGAEIKKSATCHKTEYTIKNGKLVPITNDSN